MTLFLAFQPYTIRDREDPPFSVALRSAAGQRRDDLFRHLRGKLIFINFDDDAPSLLDYLGPLAKEWEEFQFDECRLAARHRFVLDCN